MKKKLVNYLLIAALVLIWGIIIYRVIEARGDDEGTPVVNNVTTVRKKILDNNDHQDTMHLLLNYRNPFETEIKKDPEEIPVSKLVNKTPVSIPAVTSLKPIMNWNFISYTGYIRNTTSKKLLAIVSINGKEYMMAEGETNAEVKLVKNLKDSIKILFDGKPKFIAMNTK